MVTVPPGNRIRLALAALVVLAVLPARAQEPAGPVPGPAPVPAPLVVRKWLALDAVDNRGRVPFNANAPFLRHLLDRAAPPPKEGEVVKGDRAEAPWRAVAAKEDGTVEDENGAWFYGELLLPPAPLPRVHLMHLDGATAAFVNGAGFVGDLYRLKTGPVPVALEGGLNRVFVLGPRGPWRLRFEPWEEGRSPLLREDATLPDGVRSAPGLFGYASFRVVNPSLSWKSVEVDGVWDPSPPDGYSAAAMPPLWSGKTPCYSVVSTRGVDPHVRVRGHSGTRTWPEELFILEMRKPEEARRVSFVSKIDGTAQTYAVLPPSASELAPDRIATVLTLHGAGVDALDQARAYSPKPDFLFMAPTNRRPYGFDWQDWGRMDAYEALHHCLRTFRGDPTRIGLTGHSMGGHGTWHMAANDPDTWLAIAPSAGWCSFDTYGGGPRPATPLSPIWRGCDGGSRTEDLVANLVGLLTFVLHGTKDDNVPLSEAEGMLKRIEAAGGKPLHHFQEGVGHWWDGDAAPGADCVDWPGIFDLFRKATPRYRVRDTDEIINPHMGPLGPPSIDWISVDPSMDADHFWVHAAQPLEYGKPFRVRARATPDGVEVTTENVRRLDVDSPAEGPLGKCVVDGQELPVAEGFMCAHFLREGTRWIPQGGSRRHVASAVGAGEKSPNFSGPFKRAFDNRFVLVVGTKGTDEENRESMELARYHAATWWYRANGNAPVVRDADLLARPEEFEKRNLILYGNADTNAAWAKALPASCPVKVRRGAISVGEREWKGEGFGAVFIHPRADGERNARALVGAFAATGARGTRVGYGLLPFVSGVGYPDYSVFGEEFLRSGDGGVLAAGWFDHRWALQPGGFLQEESK